MNPKLANSGSIKPELAFRGQNCAKAAPMNAIWRDIRDLREKLGKNGLRFLQMS